MRLERLEIRLSEAGFLATAWKDAPTKAKIASQIAPRNAAMQIHKEMAQRSDLGLGS